MGRTLLFAAAADSVDYSVHERRTFLTLQSIPFSHNLFGESDFFVDSSFELFYLPSLLSNQVLRHLNRHLRPHNIRLRHKSVISPSQFPVTNLFGVKYVSHPAQTDPNPDKRAISVTPIAPTRKTHSSVKLLDSVLQKYPFFSGRGNKLPS